MPDTPFASLIDPPQNGAGNAQISVPNDWMQGRTVYGGLVAAMTLTSMRGLVPGERKIRSLVFSFVGPLTSDPFRIDSRILRSGKSVTTIESKVIQNDAVCTAAIGSFGGDRNSQVRVDPASRMEMPAPEQSLELPYIDGLTPAFTRHFDYRWAIGELPFTGKGGDELGGWINFRETTDCLTEEWLIALADAWPTPVLSMLKEPAAASTLTWALQFIHLDRLTCSPNDWWAYHCHVETAERGYAHERGTVWDPEGRLAVYSHQTTTVFA